MDKTLNLKQVLKRLLSTGKFGSILEEPPRVQFKIYKSMLGLKFLNSASGDSWSSGWRCKCRITAFLGWDWSFSVGHGRVSLVHPQTLEGRRKAWGSMRGSLSRRGAWGGNEESREKQGPERMSRLGILQHDAQRACFVTTRRVTRRRRKSEPRQEKGGRVSISKQRGEAVQLHPVQSMS